MRRRRADVNENLDSLLDTMANVVGILVILLAVTQISVTQAMRRIRSLEGGPSLIDAQVIEAAEQGAQAARDERARLERALAEVEPDRAAATAQLEEFRNAAEEARQRGQSADLLGLEAPEVERLIGRREGDVARLERVVAEAKASLSGLQEESGRTRGPSQKIARLPDPRPAPSNAQSVSFVCRYGRCFFVDVETLFKAMDDGMLAALGVPRVPSQLSPYEGQRLIEYFARHSIGNDELRLRFFNAGARAPFGLRIDWRAERAGETESGLVLEDSEYKKVILSRSPRSHYFKFYVWSDSFDAYLAAREIATKLGFAAGWVAFPADADLFVTSGRLDTDRVD